MMRWWLLACLGLGLAVPAWAAPAPATQVPMAADYPPEVRAATAGEEAALGDALAQGLAAYERRDLAGLQSHGASALQILDATLGPRHPFRAVLAAHLATSLHVLGADAQAAALLDEALTVLHARWPGDHPQLRDVAARHVPVLLALDVPAHAWPEHLSLWQLRVQARREPAAGDDLGHAAWLDAAGLIADAQGDHEYAEALRRRVLEIREHALPAGHAEVGSALNRLAATLARLGKVDEAETLARQALVVLDALPGAPVPARATALGTLARVQDLRGRPVEAEALFREALAERRRLSGEDHVLALDAQADLAAFLQAQGRAAEAEALHVAVGGALANRSRGGPRLLRLMAALADGMDTPADCRVAGERIAAVRTGLDADPLAPLALRMRLAETHGRLLACEGRHIEAAALFDQAFNQFLSLQTALDSAELATSSARYALVLAESGETAEAADRFAMQAVGIARSRRRQGFADSDAPAFSSAVARAVHRVGGGDPLAIAFHARLATAWVQAGRGDLFAPTYRNEAFLAAQDLEVSGAAHAMAQTRARAAAGDGPLAALVREQQDLSARAVVLDREVLAAIGAGDRARAEALGGELSGLGTRLGDIDARLAADFPGYAALVAPRAIPIPAVQERLAPGEAVLLVVPSRDDVHVFAVAKATVAWHRAAGAAPAVAAHVARLRCQVDPATCGDAATDGVRGVSSVYGAAVAGGGRPFDRNAAHALYQALVAPVEDALAGVSTLFVTTSGPLSALPLGVLVTAPPVAGEDDADPAVLARTPWLADRYAMVTLPAVSGLRPPHAAVAAPMDAMPGVAAGTVDFIGFGAPDLTGPAGALRAPGKVFARPAAGDAPLADVEAVRALAPLPGSRIELESLAGLFGDRARLHLGGAATERTLKHAPALGHARVVTFATHGLLPSETPGMDEPGLVLTPPARATVEDDGVLTASEVSRLALGAEWVILSACNTAASDGAPGGESLGGLARAFLHAGAGALLASHWRVADDATAALTTQTLSLQREAPSLTRAQALQAAMRAIRVGARDDGAGVPGWTPAWAHPAMWAPFVVVSDRDAAARVTRP